MLRGNLRSIGQKDSKEGSQSGKKVQWRNNVSILLSSARSDV